MRHIWEIYFSTFLPSSWHENLYLYLYIKKTTTLQSFLFLKGLTLSLPINPEGSNQQLPAEGSGSGSGLDSNKLHQEFEEITAVKSDLSTFSFTVDNTGERSRSTGKHGETNEAGSQTSRKKECETAAEEEIKGKESELSGEGEIEPEGVHSPAQRVRKVDGDTEEIEAVVEKLTYTELGSGDTNLRIFSWPEDVHGSGEDGEGVDEGKGKACDEEDGIKAEGGTESDGSKDNLQFSPSLPAQVPLFENSDENVDRHDEEGRNLGLDGQVVWDDSKEVDCDGERKGKLESEELVGGDGGEGSNAAVNVGGWHHFSSVDGLLVDATRSPMLAHLVPLLRLTDGGKDTEEGNPYTSLRTRQPHSYSLNICLYLDCCKISFISLLARHETHCHF